jgi:hypothetical protein
MYLLYETIKAAFGQSTEDVQCYKMFWLQLKLSDLYTYTDKQPVKT